MPITQSRVLSLLAEAEAFRDSFDTLVSDLRGAISRQEAEPSPDFIQIIETYLAVPRPKAERMALERQHFSREARRNDRERVRMRVKREEGK